MRKTIAALLLLAVLAGSLTACASGENSEPTVGTGEAEPAGSGILVAYLPEESGAVAQAAEAIAGAVGGTLADLSAGGGWNLNAYAFVLLGFAAQNSALPAGVQTFLRESDLGARTIYPFVLGQGNAEDAVFAAISDLEPGALLGSSALLLTEGADAESAAAWAEGLSLAGGRGRAAGRREQHRAHRRGDARAAPDALPLGGGKRARRHRLHRKQRRIL